MVTDWQSRLVRFLRWSEKYTKTDMVYLASGGLWSVIGQIVAAVTALSVSVAFAHLVPKDIYGNYKFVLSMIGIISVFSLSNFGPAVAQSAARGFDGALPEGFRLNLRWSVLIFLGSIATSGYYLYSGNTILAFGILLGGCVTPVLNGVNLAGSFLNGKQDFARATIYFGILGVMIPALALIATIFVTRNLFALITVYFLSNLLVDAYFYLRTIKIFKVHSGQSDTGMHAYGKHLSVMAILGGIAGSIDQLLLFHFVGSIELAIYSFSIGILDQVKGPAKSLDKMMQARFATRDPSHIGENIVNKMLWMFFAGAIGAVLFFFIAPLLYGMLFPAYIDAVPYARLYALSLLGLGTIPIGSYFTAHKLLREQYLMNVSGSLVQIVFMVTGVLVWGLWGLVFARVAGSIVNSLIMLVLYYYPIRTQAPYDSNA